MDIVIFPAVRVCARRGSDAFAVDARITRIASQLCAVAPAGRVAYVFTDFVGIAEDAIIIASPPAVETNLAGGGNARPGGVRIAAVGVAARDNCRCRGWSRRGSRVAQAGGGITAVRAGLREGAGVVRACAKRARKLELVAVSILAHIFIGRTTQEQACVGRNAWQWYAY